MIICVDSTDPIGPAVGLFAKEFYQGVYDALKGMASLAQTESPWVNEDLVPESLGMSEHFPITKLY